MESGGGGGGGGGGAWSAPKPVDLRRARERLWLVKLPNMLAAHAQRLSAEAGETAAAAQAAQPPTEAEQEEDEHGVPLGTLQMEFDPTAPARREHVRYKLRLAGEPRMPREYIFQRKESMSMYLFAPGVSSVSVDGVVTEKFDAQIASVFDQSYARMLREREKKSLATERQVKVVDPVQTVAKGTQSLLSMIRERTKRSLDNRKTNEDKRIRRGEQEVEDMIFALFEKEPAMSFKQIHEQTKQPEPYLRSVLGKLAVYQKGGDKQGLYQLRPEYRRAE